MLRGTENGVDIIERTLSLLKMSEEWASKNKTLLEDFLSGLENKSFLITYSGRGRIPALVMAWITRLVNSKIQHVFSSDTIVYHVLPYTEETLRLVHFASHGRESSLLRLMDTAYLMGAELLIISPPLHRALSEKVRGHRVVTVPENLDYIITSSLLALKAGFKYALKTSGRKDKRVYRIAEEVSDVSIVTADIYRRYHEYLSETLEKIMTAREIIVGYTPTIEAPAWMLEHICFEMLGKPVPVYPVSSLVERLDRGILVIMFSTMVEDDSLKEARFKTLQAGAKLIEFNINTDPATAQIYGLILAWLLRTMLEKKVMDKR